MKAIAARVRDHKSIEDSGWVTLDRLIALVGMNEAGKTAFLKALYRLNPWNQQDSEFIPLYEYPRRHWSKYKKDHEAEPAIVIEVQFELEPSEIKQLEDTYGKGVLQEKTITVKKNYKNSRTWDFEINEKNVIQFLIEKAELPTEALEAIRLSSSIIELVKLLEPMKADSKKVDEFLGALKYKNKIDLEKEIINNCFAKVLPKFVYFDDYSVMAGNVSLPELLQRIKDNKITKADETFLSLLSFVEADLKELCEKTEYEDFKAELEAASISISTEVFEFWTQNKQLRVEFDIESLNGKKVIHLRIRNDKHGGVTVSFDQRSKGFVWFFSFLAYFSQIENKTSGDLILLLDEPGLSLHAKAQSNFLDFIKNRLVAKHQVIYSTHSPFMIDPKRLDQVRMVQDIDAEGTKISGDVYKSSKDTLFPLQAALGYDLAQTLFVSPYNLLLEGPSDLIYLDVLNALAQKHQIPSLDPRWSKIPVGGLDKLTTFISLLGASDLTLAVLVDSDSKDKQRIKNLESNHFIGSKSIISIGEVLSKSSADIEDLFGDDFYLELVNGAYAEKLKTKIALKDLPPGPRIVKRIEAHIKRLNINNGEFSHYLPAQYLLMNQKEFLPLISTSSISLASVLFEKINLLMGDNGKKTVATSFRKNINEPDIEL